jgi:class 3 adenylate cyclase
LISEKRQETSYDPHSRPWYISAMNENVTEGVNWTNPYIFFTTKESGITASLKWKDSNSGRYMVIAMDILLSDLSEFTTNIDITSNGKVFIVTEQNEVIGLPKDARFFDRKTRNEFSLKKLKELDIPLLNEAMRIFQENSEPDQYKFEFDNLDWWAGVETFKLNSNKNLYIGAVVPETDFAQEIKMTRMLIYGGIILMLVFFIIILHSFDRLKKAKKIIVIERDKNEKLLLNTLPSKVVNDLKENGFSAPQKFKDVTVFFSDIVSFTQTSAVLDPKKLIEELNDIYSAFDDIMEKHRCERIKTIGDAYLAVCGMPVKNPKHAELMLSAAVEISEYLAKRNAKNSNKWQIRIGMHSGVVVGGIVGVKKYIYDVFGDTINTASRMEHYSEPGRINLSEETYHLVKDSDLLKAYDFHFEKRKPIIVKGKGETLMYFATPQGKKSTKDF